MAGTDTIQLARSVPVHAPGRAFRKTAAVPADLYDAVQPWRHLIDVVELAPPPEAARERFQAVFGRSNGVFLVRPDGYVGFASGEHAWISPA